MGEHTLLNYFNKTWQTTLLYPGIFLVAVFGGGYLLWRSLRRHGASRRLGMGRPMVGAFLGMLAAAFCSGITVLLVVKIAGPRTGVLVGGPLALVVGVVLMWLVWYTMFKLSAAETVRVSLLPLGAIVVWGLVATVAGAVPARAQELRRIARNRSYNAASTLYLALESYIGRGEGPPADLQTLVAEGLLKKGQLRCPLSPDREVGFFYEQQAAGTTGAGAKQKLIACSFSDEDPDMHVIVFHPDAEVQQKTQRANPSQFRQLLDRPENARFAQQWRKARDGGDE